MLRYLDIQNVAVIDSLHVTLERGMTVLTGETGAGKSMVIDAVNMILGARTNKALVRYGTDRAFVQAFFEAEGAVLEKLTEYGIEAEDGEVCISREITADGRSVARINGVLAPLNVLRDISGMLVNIHGQQDSQALLNPARHVEFLDGFAGNSALMEGYKAAYDAARETRKRLDALNMDEQERFRRVDLLRYQTEELEQAALVPGEREELEERRAVIANSGKIAEAVEQAYGLIYENDALSAYDAVSGAANALGGIAGFGEEFAELHRKLTDVQYALSDAAHELRSCGDRMEFDPRILEDLEERLDVLHKIERKYGGSVEAALEYYEKASAELLDLDDCENQTAALAEELQRREKALELAADKLSKSRQKAAGALAEGIRAALLDLDMPKAAFSVDIKRKDACGPNGRDSVEFLFSANPGEPQKPLAQIASGGELSRVMLALKSILADTDGVDTLIFDEIDTGVSGRAAWKIARKMQELGKAKQVLCVSHQPQLAAAAGHHFLIEKTEKNGRTVTGVRGLDAAGREAELARMIDGGAVTETARSHAREMLINARSGI